MIAEVQRVNRHLKLYDPLLFARYDSDGTIGVYRRGKRFMKYDLDGDDTLFYAVDWPEYVFALTDTWAKGGNPVPWGGDIILDRLHMIDAWAKKRYFEELEEEEQKVDAKKARHLRNEAEAFWSDSRGQFKKAFGDVLTHSMNKNENKRRLKDGYRK